jgi:RecB family exonuclease
LQFGGAMHTALKLFGDRVLAHRAVTIAELLQAFHDVFDAAQIEDPLQRHLYEQQAERQLRTFHETHASASPAVICTERSFVHAIGGVNIRGRIDRLDRVAPDTVAIVDYKTGSPRSQEDADESLQLSLYALGARAELRLNPEKLIFYNLETGTEVVTVRSEQQLREAADLVANVASSIAAGNFDPKPGYHCRWCAYREICPTQEERLYSIQPAAAVAGKVN